MLHACSYQWSKWVDTASDGWLSSSWPIYWVFDESPIFEMPTISTVGSIRRNSVQRLTKFTDMLPDTFETVRLLLRPVTIMDVDAIFGSYAQDEEVVRHLIWRPHRSRSETRAYVERCIATPSEVERTYMIVGRDDNVVRGALALRQRATHRLDCGYVLARPRWRQGLMTEVLTEVTVWALRQPSVFRIGAVCDFENIGSDRVLEKSGFIREGLLRRWLLHPNISDEPRDCYSYACVR
jgi:[ribosomal protein S5]-alanine N-acetyltransferase